MRQVQIEGFGGPEGLHVVEVADPVPAAGQVVVAVAAAGITFVETQMRAGSFVPPGLPPIESPAVFGNGVEGTVASIGPDVDRAALPTGPVVTATGGRGGYADRVAVDATGLIAAPAGLERGQAVAMLADGRTALAQLRVAELDPTDRVLVLAAAGGVGSLLVQLAHGAGATVVGAAGGPTKTAVVADLGADHVIDYADPSWPTVVRDRVGEIDVVFDGVGGELATTAAGLLRDGGRRVTIGMASGTWAPTPDGEARHIVELRGMPSGPDDNRALVEQALALAATGELRAIVGQTFDLEHAADAHRAIETHATIGKTILVPTT